MKFKLFLLLIFSFIACNDFQSPTPSEVEDDTQNFDIGSACTSNSGDLVENIEEMGIRKDMSATRSHLRIKAEYKLQTVKDGEIILKSTIVALSSYDIVESIYATIIAEKDARNKGLKIINDSIINELAIYFINK